MRLRSAAAGVLGAVAALVAAAVPAKAESLDAERLLVTFTDPSAVTHALERFGGVRVGPNGWAGLADPSQVSRLLKVRAIAPDGIVKAATTTPNDPCLNSCEGGKSEWYLSTIGATSAWDRSTGAGVTIAILDSGVDTNHPDLAGKVQVVNVAGAPGDGVGEHGTEVAGVAGAVTNNGAGVASLGWNVGLMSIKVLDAEGVGLTSTVINGIDTAVAQGAKIINLSLASTFFEQPMQDAINRAYAKGVLVVAAAGNNDDQGGTSTSPKYPAAMDHVLSVAATMQNDQIAPFSRRGPWVDVAAPGNALITTQPNGAYGLASGTSLASPIVAAAAALLVSQGIETTPDGLTEQLRRTGQPLNDGSGGIIRRLNAGQATEQALPYGGYGGGDYVAMGELDGNSQGEEIVTGAGPGGGPHVRIYSQNMNPIGGGFYAFSTAFHGGVNLAVGDVVPGSGANELVVAAGPGGGPHVRVLNPDGSPAPGAAGNGFFAYGPQFDGGVSVAAGDVRPDITGDEIITGAFSKGGPHVRVWTAEGVLLSEFFAFDSNFKGGVSVAVGNFDNANGMEIAVAAGPGAGPHVKMFRADGTPLGVGFYAYDAGFQGGVSVAATAIDGGFDELITVPRGFGGPHLRAFNVNGNATSGGVFAFLGSQSSGLNVAAGVNRIVVGTRGAPTMTRALPFSAVF